jgi:hypothetical protein
MNESFVKAKSIYERMMEQSLAKIAECASTGLPLASFADAHFHP